MNNTWAKLETPVLMIISLVIQALLAFLAPLRKSCSRGVLMGFLWLLYLCADSIALLVIGLISRSPLRDDDPRSDILAFWAPFLLLHLGGPDTITALALEDNELWHRHALQLFSQTAVTIYVFVLSMSRGRHNRLWLPMALMFIDGFIKYAERTCALYFASREGIRASLEEEPIPNFNKWADEYYSAETSHIPSTFEVEYIHVENIDSVDDNNDDGSDHGIDEAAKIEGEIVNHAYELYNNFKGILADDVLSLKDDHKLVEALFLKQHLCKGIQTILAELNIIYDLLHTKVFLLNKKRGVLRLVCFLSLISATLLFFLDIQRGNRKYKPFDVGVSFTLLGGAILLDIASFVRFVRSDWFIVRITNLIASDQSTKFLKCVFSGLLKLSIWCKKPYSKRWCQTTSRYNLLNCSFKWKALAILDYLCIKRIKDYLIDYFYVKKKPFRLSYLEFIFTELQCKAKLVRGHENGMEQVCSARGNLVLEEDYFLVSEYLQPWTTDIEDYSQSLLTWHLATDICHWMESDKTEPRCGLSKQLSDYMVYIILRRQELVPQLVSKSDAHFKSTEKDVISAYDKVRDKTKGKMEEFFEYVVYKKSDDRIAAQVSKSNDSQSVFDEACCLAKQLMMFGDNKWEIISKVWVEMLCYAAIRSSPRYNFASLSKGGELITLVWLFMSHLGFRLPLPKDRGLRSAKLIIGK